MPWTAVLPLAPLERAKSRLRAASATAEAHQALVEALRHDTVMALLAADRVDGVVAVSRDEQCRAWARELGIAALPEPDPLPHLDRVNAAIEHAAGQLRRGRQRPSVLALVADLPLATGVAIDDVLDQLAPSAGPGRGYVADHFGSGTTLLAAVDGQLHPRFGAGSAAAHAGTGATRLRAAAGLTWDVDTPADLAAVLARPGAAATATGRLRLPRSA